MNVAIARRRARLTGSFVQQVVAGMPHSEQHVIAEIRWFPVREPVSGNRYALVRVKTSSGLTGWGECAGASEQETGTLEKEWVGRPATQYAAIDGSTPLAGALDMAMLDILGKACRAPVYRVLGGPTRNKIRAFTDSAAAPGFHAVALRVPPPASRNQGKAYQNQVRALTKLLKDGRDFVLDAHGQLTPGDAARLRPPSRPCIRCGSTSPAPSSNLEAVRKVSAER